MSRDTKQQVEDLFAMGFIQESEYIARMAAIGESVKSTTTHAAPMASSRDRLISSFDHGFTTVAGNYHGNALATGSIVSRKPFFVAKAKEDKNCQCAQSQCGRCGAQVPSCCDEEHRYVCHADSSPHSLLEWDCPLAYLGCRTRVTAKSWSAHVARECDYAQVTCRCLVNWLDTAPELTPTGRWWLQRGVVCLESRLRDATLEHMNTVHQTSMTNTGELIETPHRHAAVACPLEYDGCKARMPIGQVAEHLLTCPRNITVCHGALSESKLLLPSGIVPVDTPHDATRASDRRAIRDYHDEYDAASDSESVADPNLQPPCFSEQLRCDVPQHHVDSHLSRAVATAGHVAPRLECPLCQRRVGLRRFGAHLERCSGYTVSCPHCYEDIGHRNQIDQHRCATRRPQLPFADQLRIAFEQNQLLAKSEKPEEVVEQTDHWQPKTTDWGW